MPNYEQAIKAVLTDREQAEGNLKSSGSEEDYAFWLGQLDAMDMLKIALDNVDSADFSDLHYVGDDYLEGVTELFKTYIFNLDE